MTIEHLKIARLVEALLTDHEGSITDDEVTALAWASKNQDWLGLNSQLADPRVVKLLNLVEDVYFNRVPDPTDGATQVSHVPREGEVAKTKIGRFLFY